MMMLLFWLLLLLLFLLLSLLLLFLHNRREAQHVLTALIDGHVKEETKLREKKFKMETEKDNWIAKYDKVCVVVVVVVIVAAVVVVVFLVVVVVVDIFVAILSFLTTNIKFENQNEKI